MPLDLEYVARQYFNDLVNRDKITKSKLARDMGIDRPQLDRALGVHKTETGYFSLTNLSSYATAQGIALSDFLHKLSGFAQSLEAPIEAEATVDKDMDDISSGKVPSPSTEEEGSDDSDGSRPPPRSSDEVPPKKRGR